MEKEKKREYEIRIHFCPDQKVVFDCEAQNAFVCTKTNSTSPVKKQENNQPIQVCYRR